MTFQDIILTLQNFWAKQNCILSQPYDVEKGAGTMNPSTFLRALGPEPWHVAYVEPSRRPADGRYGENPNRLFQHHQFQVIMKPSPEKNMIFALLKITGNLRRLVHGDLVGKFGLMVWKLLNLRIFNK